MYVQSMYMKCITNLILDLAQQLRTMGISRLVYRKWCGAILRELLIEWTNSIFIETRCRLLNLATLLNDIFNETLFN
jgi:hypothetical protein